MIYAIIGLLIALPIVGFICYHKGMKKGLNDFLEILFESGFDSKVESFKVLNKHIDTGGSVFVGDSITQDYNVYEYFKGETVYNRGIGGDTSKGLLNRIKESVDDLNPKKVFLQIGTNDFELLDASPDEVYVRLRGVVEHINKLSSNIKIYLISIYPVNENISRQTVGKRNNAKIEQTNNLLKQIKGCSFVNIYDKLMLDGHLNPLYTVEGLHLNQMGYEVVTSVLKPLIKD